MLLLQDKGDDLKSFGFYNNADEMKKKCFRHRRFFLSEREDARLDNVRDIGYVISEATILEQLIKMDQARR